MPYLFKRISGVRGKVLIPNLDAVIGITESWELTRRGADSGTSRYDLSAVFSYVNPVLLNDPDYVKEIRIILGRSKELRAQLTGTEETVLNGRALLVKGIQLYEPQDGDRS